MRTKTFALRCMKLCDALPNSRSGRAIGNQLVRSATSVGANYRAACRARSRKEWVAKLGIVREEADESHYWIELIRDARLLSARQCSELADEAEQLTKILNAAYVTTRRRDSGKSTSQTSPRQT